MPSSRNSAGSAPPPSPSARPPPQARSRPNVGRCMGRAGQPPPTMSGRGRMRAGCHVHREDRGQDQSSPYGGARHPMPRAIFGAAQGLMSSQGARGAAARGGGVRPPSGRRRGGGGDRRCAARPTLPSTRARRAAVLRSGHRQPPWCRGQGSCGARPASPSAPDRAPTPVAGGAARTTCAVARTPHLVLAAREHASAGKARPPRSRRRDRGPKEVRAAGLPDPVQLVPARGPGRRHRSPRRGL